MRNLLKLKITELDTFRTTSVDFNDMRISKYKKDGDDEFFIDILHLCYITNKSNKKFNQNSNDAILSRDGSAL